MRWIIVTLVFLNMLYFGWEYWQKHSAPVQPEQVQVPVESDSAGQDLVLLTERLPVSTSPAPPPSIAPDRPKIEPPQMPPMIREPERKVCARVGPFTSEADSMAAVSQLQAAGVKTAAAAPQEAVNVQHWVLLLPVESRRRALQTLRELQARKIDSYLITSGQMKNAISLGLFSRETLAKGVQEKIREAGYPAEILRKEKPEKTFWVQMTVSQPFDNARKVLDSLVSEKDGIKISNTPCEMFAQSN